MKRNPDPGHRLVMGRRQPRVLDQASAAEMRVEKLQRQRQRALRLRLRVGLAAVTREGMIGTGIFVDRHQRIGCPLTEMSLSSSDTHKLNGLA